MTTWRLLTVGPTAVVDANVLHDISVTDLLLRACQARAFRIRWTEKILYELVESLLRRPQLDATSVRRRVEAMRDAFPEAMVVGHAALPTSVELPDKDDRHVVAAAVAAGADVIVTHNGRDFPDRALAPLGLEVIGPDDFLVRLHEVDHEVMEIALRQMVNARRKPPTTRERLLDRLEARGLNRFVEALRSRR